MSNNYDSDCKFDAGPDAVFRVVAARSGSLAVDAFFSASAAGEICFYKGTCGTSPISPACSDGWASGEMPVQLEGVDANADYYVVVAMDEPFNDISAVTPAFNIIIRN